jgi:hypothetical protein
MSSRQFGLRSAPIIPHFVHTMRGPNDGTVRSLGRWSTFTITRCRQLWHWTSSDRTPFWRMFAKSIGSIGSVMRRVATYHSTSRARIVAGLSGFLTLIQSAERPDLYGAPSRFETMPSRRSNFGATSDRHSPEPKTRNGGGLS